jgi:hypothetical protein
VLWNVTVPLPDDLRGRRLEDGATGERRPLVERLPAPRWLPDGWALLFETAGDGAAGGVSMGLWGASDTQRRASPADQGQVAAGAGRAGDGGGDPAEAPGGLEPLAGHPGGRPHGGAGSRAEVDADPRDRNVNVRWREGDVADVVTGHARQGAKLRHVQEVVVRIAQSLR